AIRHFPVIRMWSHLCATQSRGACPRTPANTAGRGRTTGLRPDGVRTVRPRPVSVRRSPARMQARHGAGEKLGQSEEGPPELPEPPDPLLPGRPNSPPNSCAPAPAAVSAKPLTSPTNGSEVRFHESW